MVQGVNRAVVQMRLGGPTPQHNTMGIDLLFLLCHVQGFYADP
jgi:hypothetical protein